MATVKAIQVVRLLGPRVDLAAAIELEQIARDIAEDSSFAVADVASMLHKAANRRDFYLRLGHYSPKDDSPHGRVGNYTQD